MTDPSGRHAIVLAAGAGRRFGGGKLTSAWRGRPLIEAVARLALSAAVERVTVVTGADPGVEAAVAALAEPRLRFVAAPDWEEGLAASLRTGVAALPVDAQAVVVFLGDMPRVPASLADRLLDAVVAGAPAAVVRSASGPAHPAAFAVSLFPQLLALRGDRGARTVLNGLGEAVVGIESDDPGVVFDIDRPHDLDGDPEETASVNVSRDRGPRP